MKIAIYSSRQYERTFLEKNPPSILQQQNDNNNNMEAANNFEFEYIALPLNATTAIMAKNVHADAVCVFVNDVVDERTIEILATECNVHLILLRCAGYNQVNLQAAVKYNVVVCRVPAYSPYAVAEFAVALLLTVCRKTHKAYNRTREHNFALTGLMGFDIHGKTVGICGTGKIGRIFAKIMLGFGTNVIAYDLYPSDEAKKMGVRYVPTLDELLQQSDIISLHCPLLTSTKNMINHDAVNKMKHGVTIINTSRGELMDMDSILYGLQNRIIGGCGMDVIEGERDLFFNDHSGEILSDDRISMLLSYPNVVLTPHIAFCTDTALSNIWTTTLQNATEYKNQYNNNNNSNGTDEAHSSSTPPPKLTNQVLPPPS